MSPTYDPVKIKHFEKMFADAIDYARNVQLPVVVVESAMRDTLVKLEGQRLLTAMREAGGKL